jgi:uncharacterized protein YrrD
LGVVEDLLFSEDQNHVLGFLLKPGWVAERIFVAFGDVDAFGPDALIARPVHGVQQPTPGPRDRQSAIRGKRVVTRDGRDLGVVKDLYFDDTSGEILGYELANNALGGLLPRRYVLPPGEGLSVGVDVVLVEPEAADSMERKAEALKHMEAKEEGRS